MQTPNTLANVSFNPFDPLDDPICDALYRGWVRQYAKVFTDADAEYPYASHWHLSPEWQAWCDYWNGERGIALPDCAIWLIDRYGMAKYKPGCPECGILYTHHPNCPNAN